MSWRSRRWGLSGPCEDVPVLPGDVHLFAALGIGAPDTRAYSPDYLVPAWAWNILQCAAIDQASAVLAAVRDDPRLQDAVRAAAEVGPDLVKALADDVARQTA